MEKTCTTALGPLLQPQTLLSPPQVLSLDGTHAVQFNQLLSQSECDAIIAATEALGYGKTYYDPQYRGNLRLLCDDSGLAEALWPRIAPVMAGIAVAYKNQQWHPVGLNSRFRFAKYAPGTRFERHVDSFYENRQTGTRSFYTVNIYLNHAVGATRFHLGTQCQLDRGRSVQDFECTPGAALLFQQAPIANLVHEGLPVQAVPGSDVKYLMRTDVMFAAQSEHLLDTEWQLPRVF